MDARPGTEGDLVRRDSFGLMRRERRNVLVALILFLGGTIATAAQPETVEGSVGASVDEDVRLTVEVSWGIPADRAGVCRVRSPRVAATEPEFDPGADRGACGRGCWSGRRPGWRSRTVEPASPATSTPGPVPRGAGGWERRRRGGCAPGSKRRWMPAWSCGAAIRW